MANLQVTPAPAGTKRSRGSIAFFGTYRPPVPLDIFSCPINPPPQTAMDELHLTDGKSYNQNGQPIPAAALKELLTFFHNKNPTLASEHGVTPEDAEMGRVTGMVFVSERDRGLETLHVALRRHGVRRFAGGEVTVLSLGDIYGADTFGGVRMEDSGCIAGSSAGGYSLVYVSTKEPAKARRTPWTAVYKTNLADGETERLTPVGEYDLSPAVSPSGTTVAVANFQDNQWNGEIEKLKTDIVIMNVDQGGLGRRVLIKDGGWPTWGSDTVIFFHRGVETESDPPSNTFHWGVFRYDIATGKEERMTPESIDAMTPAAISDTTVAVATVREKSSQGRKSRHIEIFSTASPPVAITEKTHPLEDHYNPFVLDLDLDLGGGGGGGRRVGYHRTGTLLKTQTSSSRANVLVEGNFDKLQPPESLADVGLFRVTGVFPSVSKNGEKLAFVDNDFTAVWIADSTRLRKVYTPTKSKSVFSTSWNQNDDMDTLYVCEGPAFSIDESVQIVRISNVCSDDREVAVLTNAAYNCAFPSTNAEGTKLVFRSSRDRVAGGERKHKNLYIMDAHKGEDAAGGGGVAVALTDGPWTDTHCSWAPQEGSDWIVFSSSGRPESDVVKGKDEPELDQGLDPGYFRVYLVNAKDAGEGGQVPVPVRVIHSAPTIAGHVNHPVFSPDMASIVFTADLAGVSADPISMPHFTHSVRPYGDIFSVNLRDTKDMAKNRDIQEFVRITHSRYEYSTPTWSAIAGDGEDPNAKWWMLRSLPDSTPRCPYAHLCGSKQAQ